MKSHSVKNGGLRIDLYLFDLIPDLTRSKIQSLIKSGKVLIDSKPTKPSYILKGSEQISYSLDTPSTITLNKIEFSFDVMLILFDLFRFDLILFMLSHLVLLNGCAKFNLI